MSTSKTLRRPALARLMVLGLALILMSAFAPDASAQFRWGGNRGGYSGRGNDGYYPNGYYSRGYGGVYGPGYAPGRFGPRVSIPSYGFYSYGVPYPGPYAAPFVAPGLRYRYGGSYGPY